MRSVFEEHAAGAETLDEAVAARGDVARAERRFAHPEMRGDPRDVGRADMHHALWARAAVARALAAEAERESGVPHARARYQMGRS